MAQALLGRGLAPLGIDVRSAGTIAVDGHPVTSEITELLHSEGVVDFAHGSRFMSERILAEADLVFAMTAGHRQDIVRALPSLARRAFTLVEFPVLAEQTGTEELREAAAKSGSMRDKLRAVARTVARQPATQLPAETIDIVDPYRRDAAVYQQMARQLVPAADATIDVLTRVLQPQEGTLKDEHRG